MKITKSQLRQMIREEILKESAANELKVGDPVKLRHRSLMGADGKRPRGEIEKFIPAPEDYRGKGSGERAIVTLTFIPEDKIERAKALGLGEVGKKIFMPLEGIEIDSEHGKEESERTEYEEPYA